MAVLTSTVIAAVGLGLAAGGVATSTVAQMEASQQAKKAEKVRQAQMELSAQRQRRQAIRESVVARSQALAAATAQGAQFGSGLEGGRSQITSEAGHNVNNINNSALLGRQLFRANARQQSAQGIASLGNGISSLGGALVQNSQTLGRVTNYTMGWDENFGG